MERQIDPSGWRGEEESLAADDRPGRAVTFTARLLIAISVFCMANCGCHSLKQWWDNGFKVGPNYQTPPASVASDWIDAHDPRVVSCDSGELCQWWTVFNDPVLDSLIEIAYHQNLDAQRAGFRILEARANADMTKGNLFPQSQSAVGTYVAGQMSDTLTQGALQDKFGLWLVGGYASWELDFWGRFRRQMESAEADAEAAIENQRDVIVILLSDVATNYVQLRTYQQRLDLAHRNLELQQGTLDLTESRFRQGTADESDVSQAKANLADTAASIPQLEIGLRQANNRLCILLGQPVTNLADGLILCPIPTAPTTVAIGVPADLLRRRPDVHRVERELASQCAQIGYAESDLYPHLSLQGFLGTSSDQFAKMWTNASITGFVVPAVQWKILNYGRVRNNIRIQEARFEQKALEYEQIVLKAGQEAEDALIGFLKTQEQAHHLATSVESLEQLTKLVTKQYECGATDFNRVYTTQLALVDKQDRLATAQQDIALFLIKVYRALGGGWECCDQIGSCHFDAATTPPSAEQLLPDAAPTSANE